jgi:hypothetical protein
VTATNRDLAAMRQVIESELYRLTMLGKMSALSGDTPIATEIARLQRERVAPCAAIVRRRAEASRQVVSFSRWISGDAALNSVRLDLPRIAPASGRGLPASLGSF